MLRMLTPVVSGADARPVALGGTIGIPTGAAIRRLIYLQGSVFFLFSPSTYCRCLSYFATSLG